MWLCPVPGPHGGCGCVLSQDVTLERDMEFWVSLCCMFKVSEQISSLIRILQFLSGMPQDKRDGGERGRTVTFITLD